MVASQIYEKLLEQIPDMAPLFNAVPELRPLFIRKVTENWTTTKFANELHKTDWWKNTPESARLWLATVGSDPAQSNRQRMQRTTDLARIAESEGVSLTMQEFALLSEASLQQGWTEAEIRDAIINSAHRDDPKTGTLDATVTNLKGIASEYGVPTGDQQLFGWARRIGTGRSSQEAFEEVMREHAKSLYPTLADHIDRGISVRQYAEPYAQVAAQYLDMNPADFDLTDPKWNAALQTTRHDGNKTSLAPVSLADWKHKLMVDKQYGWEKSSMAQNDAVAFENSLAEMFGHKP